MIILLVLIVIAGIFYFYKFSYQKESVSILTQKKDYAMNDELKLKIENGMDNKICFSSCYPYYIQEKQNGWNAYSYPECGQENVVSNCVDPKTAKAFGITLNDFSLGGDGHRLAIPACIGCVIGEKFRVDKIFYSNEFEVNK